MGTFKEYLNDNKASDIFGPLISGYDLRTCVELKKKLKKNIDKVFVLCALPSLCLMTIGGIIALALKFMADMGWITVAENDLSILAFLFLAYCFIFIYAGYATAMSMIIHQCDKRIDVIAGVSDGKETA